MKLDVRHLGSALLLGVALVAPARGASTPCHPDGSKTLAETSSARVYQIARTRSGQSTLYTYGCLKEFESQVLLASGNLIVMSDAGDLALVRATPDQHSEIARFKALEGKTWNYPAIAGGRLLVRNANEMAAYNIAAP